MDDKSNTEFRQRKDGVSAVRKGPGGRVETKMVSGPERRKTTNGRPPTSDATRSLLQAASDLKDAKEKCGQLARETEEEIDKLLQTLSDRLRS